jgi:NADH-ubiquinone oxidoreductase chain 5
MGGLIVFMPFTYTVMLIATIALLGLPWLSGFYSKDLILELAYGKYHFSSLFAFTLGTLTAFLTAFYSMRLINLVFLTKPNANQNAYKNIHSLTGFDNFTVIIPLSILALFAIFLGFFASDSVGVGSDIFGSSLFYHPSQISIIEAEFSLPLLIKLLPTILSIFGLLLAFYIYHFSYKSILSLGKFDTANIGKDGKLIKWWGLKTWKEDDYLVLPNKNGGVDYFLIPVWVAEHSIFTLYGLYQFLNGKYLLDIVYNKYIFASSLLLGYNISKILDKGIIELIGPFGLSEGTYKTSYLLKDLDTGVITTYALFITLGLVSLLFILFVI